MPCYQVNLLSVKIEAADRALLEKALKRLNLQYVRKRDNFYISTNSTFGTISIEGNQARFPPQLQSQVNEIKRAYSMETIDAAAEQFSWTVAEEDDYIVLRRYS